MRSSNPRVISPCSRKLDVALNMNPLLESCTTWSVVSMKRMTLRMSPWVQRQGRPNTHKSGAGHGMHTPKPFRVDGAGLRRGVQPHSLLAFLTLPIPCSWPTFTYIVQGGPAITGSKTQMRGEYTLPLGKFLLPHEFRRFQMSQTIPNPPEKCEWLPDTRVESHPA